MTDSRRLYVLAGIAILGALTAACGPSLQPPSLLARQDTVFFDDFAGPSLDRSKWTVIVPDWVVNDELQAYADTNATLRIARDSEAAGAVNGALVIQAHHTPGYTRPDGKKFDFISGRMDTQHKVEFTYGTVSARMKLPPGSGLWPAFWMLGNGPWPDTGEIDVMENVGEPDWVSTALHGPGYFGDTPIGSRSQFTPPDDIAHWHVYSARWSPDTIAFKVDGATTYTVTRLDIQKYGAWAFDNPKFIILNLALGGGYPHGVNKVTSPYFGLPESTVQRIDAGEVKVLVDWVLVTADGRR
jgi:beta-glucanase (GH16 family)